MLICGLVASGACRVPWVVLAEPVVSCQLLDVESAIGLAFFDAGAAAGC